jgi:hypothetical protein
MMERAGSSRDEVTEALTKLESAFRREADGPTKRRIAAARALLTGDDEDL